MTWVGVLKYKSVGAGIAIRYNKATNLADFALQKTGGFPDYEDIYSHPHGAHLPAIWPAQLFHIICERGRSLEARVRPYQGAGP